MTTRRLPLCAFALLLALPLPARLADAAASAPAITLEQIMAAPDWIGNPPEKPYWGDDGKAVYYDQKRPGEEIRDLVRLDLQTGAPRVVPPAEKGAVDAAGGDWSLDRRQKVYARRGDVYLKDVATGAVRQLTRTAEEETDPRFMAGDGRVSFRRGDAFFVYDLATGLLSQPADVRLEKDPADEDDPTYLKAQQLRLFDVLRKLKRDRDQARAEDRAEQAADATRPPLPFYLGDKVKIAGAALSPAGDWLLLVTIPKPKEGEEAGKTAMPKYVTESGNVEVENVRPKVGAPQVARSLTLLDLRAHRRYDLDLAALPGILDDPLKEMRAKAEKVKAEAKKAHEAKEARERGEPAAAVKEEATKTEKTGKVEAAKEKEKPEPRPCDVTDLEWSRDARQVAVQLRAFDNKDRWLATIDLAGHRLVTRERLTDPAWVNWDHNDFGWLADNRTLWYLSERSGYSHLWAVDVAATPMVAGRQLTKGDFEVSAPVPSRDGKSIYYLANAGHPGIYEVWRLEVATGSAQQLTRLGGLNTFQLSPDERSLLLDHSSLAHPDELYVQDLDGVEASARQVTRTVTDVFLAVDWTVPEIVAIPSTHVSRPIYSRLYTPKDFDPARRYPAVVFVHGAGYLQDAHQGWSYYWHEFLFHTLLNRHGYVVLDMDYRASAGYGRDWRTAIYRQMGHPELEDLEDGVAWLAAHAKVDAKRVGVYGGSYGGFMTYMALFRAPDLFAAGAALRPVSDWAHYNEDYTGAILNTPELDPEAYAASSPIELAAGLTKPLLICDGVQDDNVFFQDNVRMVQRLIELKKENFEIAFYPLESHAFKQPTSWLDEYRRIFKLFEAHLKG
ncbi:MAG TPA: prolyl oligopeptidase family serine peptidase [Thermoanaerobaculia bacterium]|nr:prolyl oligopeptidase family serine peptidase [Thermoanaerobaculia bacterium]